MKRMHAALLAVLAVGFLGMGGLGGPPPGEIPQPEDFFAATIVDKDLVRSTADWVACDGQTFLPGMRGKAEVNVPFARIDKIAFTDEDRLNQRAKITLTDGKNAELLVKNSLECTGYTALGNMTIKVQHLHEVTFDHNAAPPAEPAAEEAGSDESGTGGGQ